MDRRLAWTALVIGSALTARVENLRAQSSAHACGTCADYAIATRNVASIRSDSLAEISGIAASRTQQRVWYVHNDSGDRARFFAIDDTGATLREFDLTGGNAEDWEDIAVGPCPLGSCVFLGDIGDNSVARREYAIDRVREPEAASLHPGAPVTLAFERFRFVYPDGPHDAEALVVDPQRGDAYVITKSLARAAVYKFTAPFHDNEVRTLTHVADVRVPSGLFRVVTAADAHPCARRIILRTYDRVFELRGNENASFEAIFSASMIETPSAIELQGEGIAYRFDGAGYVTVGEGTHPMLHAVDCR